MTEKILIYLLEGCMYSQQIINMLRKEDYYYHIINVNVNDKENYKLQNKMSTFPQIFFITSNIKYMIGGIDNFKLLNNFIYNKKTFKKDFEFMKIDIDLDIKVFLRLLIYMNKERET
jgi:glutaredoxin